jgi:hypothetical protein
MMVHTEHGKRMWRRRTDGHGIIDVQYPMIVSPELWQAAQDANGGGRASVKRADVDRFLLRGGMVRCAEHDHIMTGSSDGSGRTQYRCTQQLPTGRRLTHTVPGRALDDAVWNEIAAFLLAPMRGLEASRKLAAEAQGELDRLAHERARTAARRADLERQAAYILRCARETAISPTLLEAQLKEVEAEQERLRLEEARLDAREALAQEAAPQAEELEAICCEFAHGAVDATAEQRRAILEALAVVITMTGRDYEISGIVPELTRRGTLGVHMEPSSAPRGTRSAAGSDR